MIIIQGRKLNSVNNMIVTYKYKHTLMKKSMFLITIMPCLSGFALPYVVKATPITYMFFNVSVIGLHNVQEEYIHMHTVK